MCFSDKSSKDVLQHGNRNENRVVYIDRPFMNEIATININYKLLPSRTSEINLDVL